MRARARRVFRRLPALLAVLQVVAVLSLLATAARAEDPAPLRGVALVIGQSEYEHLPSLANPAGDADAIEELLSELGFDLVRRSNRDAATLTRDIDRFVEDAAGADVAILYYAGHGIEAGGENFLVPVDADLTALDAAAERLVPISAHLRRLQATVPVTILILDACRDNPFPADARVRLDPASEPAPMGVSGLAETRGAAPLADAAPAVDSLGTVLAFAAEPGRAALDGEPGGNSPYTAAILRHLDAMTGEEFGTVMRMVAEEVYLKTGGRQRPWINESLRRLLYFGGAPEPVPGEEGVMLRERRQLLVTIADLPSPERARVERVAGLKQVPMDAVYGLLRVLGGEVPDNDPGKLEELLVAEAERYATVVAERQVIASPDAEIVRLSALADEAEAEGLFESARKLRNDAKARFEMLRPTLQATQSTLDERFAEGAVVYARSAGTRALGFDHLGAADDYAEAHALVEGRDAALAFRYREQQALALVDHAYYRPGRDAFDRAIAIARAAVLLAEPLDARARGSALNTLGRALQIAGSEAADVASLREAEAAYRGALQDRTRAADADAWATTMSNLGYVLRAIGEREPTPGTLHASVEAFGEALAVRSPDRDPVRWAHSTMGLAGAHFRLGEREAGTASFELAVEGFRAALGVLDPEREPHRTAFAHGGLGDALQKLGERSGDLARIDEALGFYAAGLALVDRDRQRGLWTYLMQNRATALVALGRSRYDAARIREALAVLREVAPVLPGAGQEMMVAANRAAQGDALAWIGLTTHDTAPLDEAVAAYREAAGAIARAEHPLFWANVQNSLGSALETAGRLKRDPATLSAAADAFRAALEEMIRARSPLEYAMVNTNLANALRARAELGNDASVLPEAQAAIEAALGQYSAAGQPLQFASAANTAGTVLKITGILTDDLDPIVRSAGLFRQALEVWTADAYPYQRAIASDNLATVLAIVGRSTGDPAALEEALATFREARGLYIKGGTDQFEAIMAEEIAALERDLAATPRSRKKN